MLKDTKGGIQTRGQVADYVAEIMLHQHRTFVYMVTVYRTSARIMKWERNGCAITTSIDLLKEPQKLYEFFWRLRHATDADLGVDPTATRLPEDALKTSGLLEAFKGLPDSRVKPLIEAALIHPQRPLYRLEVPNHRDSAQTCTFIVRNPSAESLGPTGRSTKPFIAFDEKEKKFCFVKDLWRADCDGSRTELDNYAILHRFKVPFIATVRAGGDLKLLPSDGLEGNDTGAASGELQATTVQDLRKKGTIYHRRIHSRLVLKEVCIPLKCYTTSRELCSMTLGAALGTPTIL